MALKAPSSLGELFIDCLVHVLGVVGGRMYEYVQAKKGDASQLHTSSPTTPATEAMYYTPQTVAKPQSALDEYGADWKHQSQSTSSSGPSSSPAMRGGSDLIFGRSSTGSPPASPYPSGARAVQGVPPGGHPVSPAGPSNAVIPVQANPVPPPRNAGLGVDTTNSKTVASDFGFPSDLQVNNLSSGQLSQGLSQGTTRRSSGW